MLIRFTGYADVQVGANNALAWWNEIRVGIYVSRVDESDGFSPPLIDLNDFTHDWVWFQIYQLFHVGGEVLSQISIPATAGPHQGVIDLRTKRKIPEGYGLAMAVGNMDETASDSDVLMPFNFATQGRFLLLDH